MARVEARDVGLRDGRRVALRSGEPSDVATLLEYLHELLTADGQHQVMQADELDGEGPRLVERLSKAAEDPRSLHLHAWSGGQIVGDALFQGGLKRRARHTGWIGLGVRPAWQGVGLGRALLEAVLGWAAAHEEIERVQLRVFCENWRAIALYGSLGFVTECRSVRAFRLEDGSYADEYAMCLYVKPHRTPEGFAPYLPRASGPG